MVSTPPEGCCEDMRVKEGDRKIDVIYSTLEGRKRE
jgi:hypothetical protein